MKPSLIFEMLVRNANASDVEGVYRLLQSNGWSHRVGDINKVEQLILASQRVVVAVIDEDIIGFARAITDGISNGYVSMVVVDEAWRRRGVGHALVERLVGCEPDITWMLRAGREGASAFFSKLGFTPSTTAMERPRR